MMVAVAVGVHFAVGQYSRSMTSNVEVGISVMIQPQRN